MSTRSTTHFTYPEAPSPEAIIYRHADGYPTGAGADILRFLDEVKRDVPDTRFGDAGYLAAKYVVFLAREFSVDYDWSTTPHTTKPKASRLDFLSVGVTNGDPGDIEYRYTIVAGTDDGHGLPRVLVDDLSGNPPVQLTAKLAGIKEEVRS